MKGIYIFLFLILFSAETFSQSFIYNNGISIVNSAQLTTNGDWINDAGTSIKNDGAITTSDNWTNNGTLDAASTGGFVLNFSTNKNFTPGGTNFGFLTKAGTGNATISGPFSLKDSLSIKGGVITPLAATDILTVSETGTIISVPGSFVEGGNMVRKGTGALFFPVGKNGVPMPITFLKVAGTNPSISVEIEDAPANYTAGAGVDALANFPYVWKSVKTNVTDTANYVELQYPNSLPVPANAIVARKVDGQNKYEGMGARLFSNSGGIVKIRSYSRGLQGVFTVASGFAGNLETDSLALVALFNGSNGTAWTKKSNWKSGALASWQGVTQTGQSITSLTLNGAGISGVVPDEIADILSLQTVNLSDNAITKIPNFSSLTALTSLNVSGNKLDFASLEGNATIPGINYVNQAEINLPTDELISVGTAYTLKVTTGGTANQYQWKKNVIAIPGATTNQYDIPAMGRSNSGTYQLEVTNSLVPGLVLKSATQRATPVANVAGKLQVNATTPVTNGKMLLLKINPGGIGYDTTRVQSVKTDGTYVMEKVVLDDYILVGVGDVVAYKDYFPTYFDGSVFWEEATKIVLNENRTGVDIRLQALPTVKPSGDGQLSGTLSVGNLAGGRTQKERVQGAGASVRRGTKSGRPTHTLEGEDIVMFLYTNANGEFDFTDLEEGPYILNIQYPGVPMDPESDIYITLGPKAKRQNVQKVDAVAETGKITVKRRIIVGLEEEESATVKVYPNPAAEELFVEMESGMREGIAVLTDMSGAEHMRISLNEFQKKIDVRALPTGVYIVTVHYQNKQVSKSKIVIR